MCVREPRPQPPARAAADASDLRHHVGAVRYARLWDRTPTLRTQPRTSNLRRGMICRVRRLWLLRRSSSTRALVTWWPRRAWRRWPWASGSSARSTPATTGPPASATRSCTARRTSLWRTWRARSRPSRRRWARRSCGARAAGPALRLLGAAYRCVLEDSFSAPCRAAQSASADCAL